jgi:hypothetical protein
VAVTTAGFTGHTFTAQAAAEELIDLRFKDGLQYLADLFPTQHLKGAQEIFATINLG